MLGVVLGEGGVRENPGTNTTFRKLKWGSVPSMEGLAGKGGK
jgi:hypothetical protein